MFFVGSPEQRRLRDRGLVPRFHITWGTGPAIVEVFARRLRNSDRVTFAHRRRVDELVVSDGPVVGVRGAVLEPTDAARGVASSRNIVNYFVFRAQSVIVASGGDRRQSPAPVQAFVDKGLDFVSAPRCGSWYPR